MTKQAIFALMIVSSAPVCGMMKLFKTRPSFSPKRVAQELEYGAKEIAYYPSVAVVDCLMAIGSTITHGYFKFTKKDPILIKKEIENQLAILHRNVKNSRDSITRDIAHDFKLNDRELEDFNSSLQLYKECATQSLQQKLSHISVHQDKNFPEEIMPILEKNKVNSKALSLIVSETPNSSAQATAGSPDFKYFYRNKERIKLFLTTEDIESPSEITLYPGFFTQGLFSCFKNTNFVKRLQKPTLIHEMGHILEHHHLQNRFILHRINQLTGTSFDAIEANSHYQESEKQHEREAEIFPALKCKDDATILRDYRRKHFYPKKLYGAHYVDLAFIDTLHKLDAKLTVSK